jgi:type 1 glutamine amidotransferase
MPLKIFDRRYLMIMASFLTILFFACESDEGTEIDRTPPTVPGNLKAVDITYSSIDIVWEASTDNLSIVAYKVFQGTTLLATVPNTEYRAIDLLPDTEYSFSVSAIDKADNESVPSDVLVFTTEKETDTVQRDTIPPTKPLDLIVLDSTQTSIALSWSAATDGIGVVGYRVFQDSVVIDTVPETQYQAIDLLAGTSYSFAVSALDAADNESPPSAPLSVTTLDEVQSTVDKVLVFTKTLEFRHTSIAKGVATLTALGQANNFEVVQTENGADFNSGNLQQYKAVAFLSTTGDVLNGTQQAAFENYIRAGGGFMGIHSATDTEYDWPWYGQLVGAYLNGHPDVQQASLNVVDYNHPSTSQLPDPWNRTDEWYNFRDINPNINVLLNLDESTYQGGTNGSDHPHAWYHEFDGGRSFYTGGGHSNANYDEPNFRQHLLGGILYCLGR